MWQHPFVATRTYQLLRKNSVLAGDSSSGFRRGISLWPQEIQPREREEKNKEQTNNKGLGQLKCKKGGSVTLHSLCIRRLTLTCIFREISTKPRGMLTHLDWSSLIAPGPYLMPTGLFCCPLSTAPLRHPSPTAFCGFLLPTPLWPAFPCPLPVASRSRAFVWFRAKTNKKIVCLARPLHSVTHIYMCIFVLMYPCRI